MSKSDPLRSVDYLSHMALMYTMRNRVAHGYFKVDFELVWKTIHVDLPELREQVSKLDFS